jgi:multiple sugar transport system permease protein
VAGRKSTSEGIALLPAHILVWTYAALLGIPIYFVFISAFKDNIAIFDTPLAFPTSFSFNNFVEAWNTVKLGRGLINSLIVTTMSLSPLRYLLHMALRVAKERSALLSKGSLLWAFLSLRSQRWFLPCFSLSN